DHPRPTLAAKSTTGTAINEVGRIVTVSPALEVAAGGVVELDVGNGTFHIDDDSGLAGRDRVVDRRENRRAVALDDDDSITIYLGVERVAGAPVRRGFLRQHIHHAIDVLHDRRGSGKILPRADSVKSFGRRRGGAQENARV